jgi:translation initiation factor IF-1
MITLIQALVMALAFSFGMVSLGHGTEPSPSDLSNGAVSQPIVKGDVQLIEGEFYFVKDTSGHEVRLHVNGQTNLEDRIKVGDKIEARVTPQGHATSIAVQIPQNGTAPPRTKMDPTSSR